jgi:two-component system, LuxR family, sensor kinase FixL
MQQQSRLKTAGHALPLVTRMARSYLVTGSAYLAAYVLFDWVSYVQPFAEFGITPWNPQTGLSFALILLFGRSYLPWLIIAPLAADLIVRELPLPLTAEALMVLVTALGYGAGTLLLLSRRIDFDPTLPSRRSLIWLLGVAAISIAAVSLAHGLILFGHGMIPAADIGQASLRAFVGDLIGVMVFTPFLLVAFTRRRMPLPSLEAGIVLLLILGALWVVFGFTEAFRFQLFYVFFLPVVWIAVRFGLEGVTLGIAVIQIGVIAVVEVMGRETVGDVVAYQALMIVLTATGLSIGVLVSEQNRTQAQLRAHQDSLNRVSRLATMGEFAAAVAHEINQPLTAIGNFARLARSAAEQSPPDPQAAASAAGDAIAQVDRAGAVIKRLRDLIRLGRIEKRPVAVATLVHESLAVCRLDLERQGIATETRLDRGLPLVLADTLQVEQVLLNLIRNAAEALSHAGRKDGRIIIEASARPVGMVTMQVTDNGPGIEPDLAGQPITPFATTKRDGLGLGLSLSRSIVEAHGGKLRLESTVRGVCASFTLPATGAENTGAADTGAEAR